jgi:hypothetical protein
MLGLFFNSRPLSKCITNYEDEIRFILRLVCLVVIMLLFSVVFSALTFIQGARMKGVQNKIIISQKAFTIHIYGLHYYKGKLSKFF